MKHFHFFVIMSISLMILVSCHPFSGGAKSGDQDSDDELENSSKELIDKIDSMDCTSTQTDPCDAAICGFKPAYNQCSDSGSSICDKYLKCFDIYYGCAGCKSGTFDASSASTCTSNYSNCISNALDDTDGDSDTSKDCPPGLSWDDIQQKCVSSTTQSCSGTCNVADKITFCLENDNLCYCLDGSWSEISCSAYCDSLDKIQDGCDYDDSMGADFCLCF